MKPLTDVQIEELDLLEKEAKERDKLVAKLEAKRTSIKERIEKIDKEGTPRATIERKAKLTHRRLYTILGHS